MEFLGETRSVDRPDTDAERLNPAETTDPESSATVNPQQPVTGPAQEAQQAVGTIASQPGPSNLVHETRATVTQHAELHLLEAAVHQSAGTETLQPAATVPVQPGPSEESETIVQIVVPEEEQIMTTGHGWQDPAESHGPQTQTSHAVHPETFTVSAAIGAIPMVHGAGQSPTAELLPSARRGTVGLPPGQQPGLTAAVWQNPSQRAQPVIPTIEHGHPVQEVGGFGGYLVEPEEPEHPQQPFQDYIIVFASQPSKFFICSHANRSYIQITKFACLFVVLIVSVLISGSSSYM